MKGKILATLTSGLLAVAIAGCSQPTTTAPAAAEQKMGEVGAATTMAVATGPIRSTGVVTQVDAHAGTITLNHQAISAINWPAMTMQFHAENPAILHGVAVGDHVTFQFKSATETGVVTMMQKQ